MSVGCSLEPGEGRNPWLIVRHRPAFASGPQGDIKLRFSNIYTNKDLRGRHDHPNWPDLAGCGLGGAGQLFGLWEDRTRRPMLRPVSGTQAISVYRVLILGDGDAPTSPSKDTRLYLSPHGSDEISAESSQLRGAPTPIRTRVWLGQRPLAQEEVANAIVAGKL